MSAPYLDFEQQLFDCWHVTNDLDTLYKFVCDAREINHDQMANMLLGMKQLYNVKFGQLFDQFEDNVHSGAFNNKSG